jgi:hypothetical protein
MDRNSIQRLARIAGAGIACLGATIFAAGCQSAKPPEPKPRQIGWRPIETFSGQGSTQTESFNIESTQWRIKWETRGEGKFHVVVNSAVSGRPIMDAVTHDGPGNGTVYVTEDPRLYHLVIESSGLAWSLAVDEAVAGGG